jgi:putative endonuclease
VGLHHDNKPNGVIYVGVCADIVARVAQHRDGKGSAFSKRYNLKRLIYVEPYPTIDEAIRREKAMKEWHERGRCGGSKNRTPAGTIFGT